MKATAEINKMRYEANCANLTWRVGMRNFAHPNGRVAYLGAYSSDLGPAAGSDLPLDVAFGAPPCRRIATARCGAARLRAAPLTHCTHATGRRWRPRGDPARTGPISKSHRKSPERTRAPPETQECAMHTSQPDGAGFAQYNAGYIPHGPGAVRCEFRGAPGAPHSRAGVPMRVAPRA